MRRGSYPHMWKSYPHFHIYLLDILILVAPMFTPFSHCSRKAHDEKGQLSTYVEKLSTFPHISARYNNACSHHFHIVHEKLTMRRGVIHICGKVIHISTYIC